MANKVGAKKQKAQNKPKNKQKNKNKTRVPDEVSRYAELLVHPDSGTLPSAGVYDGELGNFRRFVSTFSLGSAGHTAGVLAFCPATGNGFAASTNDGVTPPALVLTNTQFPGKTYLDANAQKTRGVACKLEAIPASASFSNLTGEVAAGVTTSGSFLNTVTTVNHLFDIAKAYAPIQRKTTSSRWIPSGLDHTYSNYNTAPDEDRNFVFIAYRGWPAGLLMTIRVTYVVEYTVKNQLGIPPSGLVSQPVGHHAVISVMQKSDPHWHHSILDEVKDAGRGIMSDLGTFARGMTRMGLSHVGSKMLKAAPAALPMLLA